ncbi:hypothetical protein WI87_23770 [Burkholderia ubonensis]|uniref:hypothetical protein n=1 Tax=Burkholderia ubonensis TaxID=101571 RepID=UPI000754D52A|nr:hypothetical protein [Burkholderia ubonensis]KVD54722.1 hypothetical protein WI87_23770 [Burkholderia ubonensis]
MIVVRTFSTVGGARSGRQFTRKLDRTARLLGYRNARAWALAIMERQLKRQSLAVEAPIKAAA